MSNINFRNDIQGFRAFAVILVFIFHLNYSLLPGGFIGVDIFFVISGYLISKIIFYKKENSNFNFKDFYIGRFKRIVPAFIVFLLFILIVGTIVFYKSDIVFLRKNLFWASLFNSNNYLATLDNYFGASSTENPLLHTWTLSLEMQFYFLLPLLIFFVNKKYILNITFLLTISLLIYSYYNIHFLNKKEAMYFSLLARVPEFLIGTMFVIKEQYLRSKLSSYKNIISLLSVFLLLLTAFVFNEQSEFPGFLVLLPCLSMGFLLVFYDSKVNLFFSNKFLVYIGELSYSIYLWHWGIMALMRYNNLEYDFSLLESFLIIVMTYIFSLLSFKLIENPVRKWRDMYSNIFIGVSYVLLFIGIYYMPKISDKLSDVPEEYIKPTFGLKSHASSFQEIEFFGDTNSANDSIILIGDSHALVYKSMLDQIGKMHQFNFYTISNDAYPTIPGINKQQFSENRYYEQYASLISNLETKLSSSKIILIGCTWSSKVKDFDIILDDFMKKIDNNQKVVVLNSFPTLNTDPIRMNKGIVRNKKFNFDYEPKLSFIPNNIKNVISKHKNLYMLTLDYTDIVNDLPFINDTVAYYDKGHLNNYGAKKIGIKVSNFFNDELNKIRKD